MPGFQNDIESMATVGQAHVPLCAPMCPYVPLCAPMCPYVPLCAPGLRASPSQELISRPASQNRSAPELKTVISKKYQ